ncbi:MAG: DUF3299 domain-containing protein [Pseudodonghicola sp.]
MTRPLTRRRALTLLAAPALAPRAAAQAAEEVVDLDWADLIPQGGGTAMARLRALGVVQHGDASAPVDQDTGVAVTTAYNGRLVRIPGYVVPLDYDGDGVTSFILVPYVGACIHVPPPPPNQLIFVTTETPFQVAGLFAPVIVTGLFGAAATGTQLAEIGYSLSAEQIAPFD